MALRVPTIDVSVVDLTVELEIPTTYEEICAEMKRRSEKDIKGYLVYTDEALVSTDFETFPTSRNALRPYVFTLRTGMTMDGGSIRAVLWT